MLNADTCLTNTDLLKGVIQLCMNGNCSSTTNLATVIASTVTGTTCNSMITEQQIDLTISSSGSSYIIDLITVTLTKSKIDFSVYKNYQIKTIINVANAASTVSYSGNPGYLLNKAVKMESSAGTYNLFNIADASGNCVISGVSTVSLLFGQNALYSCISSNPCASSLYIDQLPK